MAATMKTGQPNRTEIPVTGMHCASCVAKVEGIIKSVPGVTKVSVNLATNSASIEHQRSGFDVAAVAKSLNKGGYPAKLTVTHLSVSGMHCASCVANIEKYLLEIDGVVDAAVNLTTGSGTIKHLGVERLQEKITTALAGSGYAATIADDGHPGF
ncbi:MAG: heavy-metal-associated domain-containing protein [bacterium]|nr:heavy-metal-associated domain-containing protein [bacterium]